MNLNFFETDTEYSKDPKLKKEDVNNLMDWAYHHYVIPEINEVQAIIFLNASSYDTEFAKKLMTTCFTIKASYPKMFKNRNPLDPKISKSLNVTIFSPLPKKTPENYTIFFLKLLDSRPSNLYGTTQFKIFDMICMLHFHQDGPSDGHIAIIDMAGVVFRHLFRISLIDLKHFFHYIQEGLPGKIKRVHFLNIVSFMDKIMGLLKPFIKKQLADNLFFHKDLDDLVKFVPRECLPKEYGGSAATLIAIHEKMKTRIFKNSEFFEWEEQQTIH